MANLPVINPLTGKQVNLNVPNFINPTPAPTSVSTVSKTTGTLPIIQGNTLMAMSNPNLPAGSATVPKTATVQGFTIDKATGKPIDPRTGKPLVEVPAPSVITDNIAQTDYATIKANLDKIQQQVTELQKAKDVLVQQKAASDQAAKEAADKAALVKAAGTPETPTVPSETPTVPTYTPPAILPTYPTGTNPEDIYSLFKNDPDAFNKFATDQGWNDQQKIQFKIDKNNYTVDQDYNDYQTKVTQLQNGTFPLTSEQQSQIDSMRASFDRLKEIQKTANENYEGGVRILGIVTGREQYAPEIAGADIKQSVDQGIAKIADIETKAMAAIAELKRGFLSDDYKMITDSWDATQKYFSQKDDELGKLSDKIATAEKDVRDYNYKLNQDNADNIIKNGQLSLQEKQLELSKLQLDETTRSNKVREAIDWEKENKGNFEVVKFDDGSSRIFDKENGVYVGEPLNSLVNGGFLDTQGGTLSPGETGDAVLDNNTKQTTTGVWYVDGTNLTGKEATRIQKRAAELGLPYLGKDNATVQANIDEARANIKLVEDSMKNVLAKYSGGYNRTLNLIESVTQAGKKAPELLSMKNTLLEITTTLQAIAKTRGSTGVRSAFFIDAIAKEMPQITDILSVATVKVNKLYALLDDTEKFLYGKDYDVMKATGITDDPYQRLVNIGKIDPKYADQIVKLKSANPYWTENEILQALQY
jgi:5-bromo-4-chloroindolyl phosphate hydrolysis protein